MQPAPNALLPQEYALALDTLATVQSNPAIATATSFARDTPEKRVIVFMIEFLFHLRL
jgi:hypothetical protein